VSADKRYVPPGDHLLQHPYGLGNRYTLPIVHFAPRSRVSSQCTGARLWCHLQCRQAPSLGGN